MMVTFSVDGQPVPQGSVVAHVHGKRASIHYAQGSGLAVWRNQVTEKARDAWGETVYGGPMHIALDFHRQRPRSHYKDLYGTVKPQFLIERPTGPPDLDKLVRAILDSLTGIVWQDDAQVVSILAAKSYGAHPGVTITVGTVDA
jgi:Holliday junction resolvase RusA-like endonuclease